MSKVRSERGEFYVIRDLMEKGKPAKSISEITGLSIRTVRRYIAELKASGFDPDNERFYHNPAEQVVKGFSTLNRLKESGDTSAGKVLEWVKTNVKLQEQVDTARHLMNCMVQEIEPLPPIKHHGKKATRDQFTVIPIGDPHIGLKVWEHQTGVAWDIEIAKRVFKKVFYRLLAASPDTEECVLVNTGDFFHCDNITATSTRSGHHFDMDGTVGQWLDAGMIIARMLVDACLKKYKRVTFVNVPGNHDDLLGRMIGGFVEQLYMNNKRITVLKGDNPFQYVRRGNVLLGFAHGHTCRVSSLPGKMADDQAKLWGDTTYRHWFTGHLHHNQWLQYKEHPGCKVETVGIIPPKDAYAHGGGWGADRTIQSVVFDAKNGYQSSRYMEVVRADD